MDRLGHAELGAATGPRLAPAAAREIGSGGGRRAEADRVASAIRQAGFAIRGLVPTRATPHLNQVPNVDMGSAHDDTPARAHVERSPARRRGAGQSVAAGLFA